MHNSGHTHLLFQIDNDKVINSLPKVMKWGGKSDDLQLTNTCTVDNGLTILHLAFEMNKEFRGIIEQDDRELSKNLITIFSYVTNERFLDAK